MHFMNLPMRGRQTSDEAKRLSVLGNTAISLGRLYCAPSKWNNC